MNKQATYNMAKYARACKLVTKGNYQLPAEQMKLFKFKVLIKR